MDKVIAHSKERNLTAPETPCPAVHPHAMAHFVVYAPNGTGYLPEMTFDEARALVAERSRYEGEPGWKIVPLWLALDGEGYLRRKSGARHFAEVSHG